MMLLALTLCVVVCCVGYEAALPPPRFQDFHDGVVHFCLLSPRALAQLHGGERRSEKKPCQHLFVVFTKLPLLSQGLIVFGINLRALEGHLSGPQESHHCLSCWSRHQEGPSFHPELLQTVAECSKQ